MTPEAQQSPPAKAPGAEAQAISLSLPVSALLLGLQASAPLSGSWHAPSVVNWLLLTLLLLGAGELFRRGTPVNRVAVALLLIALMHLLAVTNWFQVVSTDHLASLLCARLSETWRGMPLVALFDAWSVLCAAWLSCSCLTQTWAPRHRFATPAAIGISGLTALVGVRAVIGYATGSTSLISG